MVRSDPKKYGSILHFYIIQNFAEIRQNTSHLSLVTLQDKERYRNICKQGNWAKPTFSKNVYRLTKQGVSYTVRGGLLSTTVYIFLLIYRNLTTLYADSSRRTFSTRRWGYFLSDDGRRKTTHSQTIYAYIDEYYIIYQKP